MQGRIAGKRNRERGMAIMLTAMMLVFLIPMVGLSIDVGVLYMLRNKMSAASDAAALGAARGLNVSGTAAQQKTAAENAAAAFFVANFPDGYLGTHSRQLVTGFTPSEAVLTVTVTARLQAPTFFMRTLGFTNVTVAGAGTATRRNTNLVLLLDKSGSMGPACADMKAGAETFVTYMSKEFDTVGLITYNDTAFDDYRPDKNWAVGDALVNDIKAISCSGSTASIPALNMGFEQLKRINQPLARNVVVFFTDGLPNNIPANYPVMTQENLRYGYGGGPNYTGIGFSGGTSGGHVCNSTGSECLMPPKVNSDGNLATGTAVRSCTDATLRHRGMLYQGSGGEWTGNTAIRDIGQTYNASTNTYSYITRSCSSTCEFTNDASRRSIAFIPPVDFFGNVVYSMATTDGVVTSPATNWNASIRGYGNLRENWYTADTKTWVKDNVNYNNYFTSSGHPYLYKMRPDSPSTVYDGGINAIDDQGYTVRKHNLSITIFSIGYRGGGNIDEEALARLANDGSALDTFAYDNETANNPNKTEQGLYIKAANGTQLRQAFATIASSVLRLSE